MNKIRGVACWLMRLFYSVVLLLSLLGGLSGLLLPVQLMAAPGGATAPTATDGAASGQAAVGNTVVVLSFSGAVTPVLDQYLAKGIERAVINGYEAVVLQLDTPGGSVEVTNAINQRILASPVPIIVYVAPTGARAGSAGTFITLAGHVAAMAPGTSIGAASPVDMSGGDINETLNAKVENILSADIENLAARRGTEAVDWALAAVQDAAAATATQALALGVIDIIAADLPDLYAQLDGFEVTVQGESRLLETADAVSLPMQLTPFQQFLNFISNPSVASILLSLGTIGLIVELRAPGFGAPGIVGAISLLLGFYALGQLNANFAGLALMGVGLALFVAELFTPTFGALAAGGAVAFVLGSILLFDQPGMRVPWPTILITTGLLTAFTIFVGSQGLKAQRRRPITGYEGLVGQRAEVRSDFRAGETGSVFVAGEWWSAKLTDGAVQAGDHVSVVGHEGYILTVKKSED